MLHYIAVDFEFSFRQAAPDRTRKPDPGQRHSRDRPSSPALTVRSPPIGPRTLHVPSESLCGDSTLGPSTVGAPERTSMNDTQDLSSPQSCNLDLSADRSVVRARRRALLASDHVHPRAAAPTPPSVARVDAISASCAGCTTPTG